MKKLLSIIALLTLFIVVNLSAQNTASIYEVGIPVVKCEDNYKNMIANWTIKNITNAQEFSGFRYEFIETINDSARYNNYRNHFSGLEMLGSATSCSSGERIDGVRRIRYRYQRITPGYRSEQFNIDRMGVKQREIMSDSLLSCIFALYKKELNIDTMKLKQYMNRQVTEKVEYMSPKSKTIRSRERSVKQNEVLSVDTISAGHLDVAIKKTKEVNELSLADRRQLIMEDILSERLLTQKYFSSRVNIGDKVYAVHFDFLGKHYSDYSICSAKTSKVVFDSFSMSIQIEMGADNK